MSNLPPPPPDDSSWSPPSPPAAPPPYQGPQAATEWTTLGTGETVQLASAGSRLGARILDGLMVLAGMIILSVISAQLGVTGAFVMLGAWLGALLYEPVMIAVKGQTLGKMAVSIKVVRADNGLVPGAGKSFGRWLIPFLLRLTFFGYFLCYLWLLWDNNRQGLHDKAAQTLVIRSD